MRKVGRRDLNKDVGMCVGLKGIVCIGGASVLRALSSSSVGLGVVVVVVLEVLGL